MILNDSLIKRLALVAFALSIVSISWTPISARADGSVKAIIVGGGPNSDNNQAAIESNVLYVQRLLIHRTAPRILYANDVPNSKIVMCEDKNGNEYYRASALRKIDGPARLIPLQYEMENLYSGITDPSKTTSLLYFTGHGAPDVDSGYDNNYYAMWAGDSLSVKNLASDISILPKNAPVVLIMVQCYAGSFGNVIFQEGDPEKALGYRNICGFFASVPTREAAGCTADINQEDYQDFTSYFFAALTGIDREGRPVTGADYNNDGKIGMDEAYAYSLIHDLSTDTPMCTSDTFLRRFVKLPEDQITNTPYSSILSWASPAQKAALNGLSNLLRLHGEKRFGGVSAAIEKISTSSEKMNDVYSIRFARLARSVILAHALQNSGAPEIKARYAQLLQAESGNPFLTQTVDSE